MGHDKDLQCWTKTEANSMSWPSKKSWFINRNTKRWKMKEGAVCKRTGGRVAFSPHPPCLVLLLSCYEFFIIFCLLIISAPFLFCYLHGISFCYSIYLGTELYCSGTLSMKLNPLYWIEVEVYCEKQIRGGTYRKAKWDRVWHLVRMRILLIWDAPLGQSDDRQSLC